MRTTFLTSFKNLPEGEAAKLLALHGARFVSGFVVGTWVARHLNPAGFGNLTFALMWATTLQFIAEAGVEPEARRLLVAYPTHRNRILAACARLRLVGTVLSLLPFAGIALFSGRGDPLLFVLASGILFYPIATLPALYLTASGRSSIWVVANLVSITLTSGLRVLAILLDSGPSAFAALASVEVAVAAVILGRLCRHRGITWSPAACEQRFLRLLKSRLVMPLLGSAAVILYMRLDQILVAKLLSLEDLGTYTAATRVSELFYAVPLAYFTAHFQKIGTSHRQGRVVYEAACQDTLDKIFCLSLLWASMLYFLSAPIIRALYGTQFAGASSALAIHAWTSLFVTLGTFRSQMLVVEKRYAFAAITSASGAVLSLVTVPLWIMYFGLEGAALSTLATYGITAYLLSPFAFGSKAFSIQTRAFTAPIRIIRKLLC